MKIKKKTIIISVAAVAAIGAGIGVLGKNLRNSQVNVYPVSDLSQSIWQSGTSLDGTIASQVSQEVRLQENQIVSAADTGSETYCRACSFRIPQKNPNGHFSAG